MRRFFLLASLAALPMLAACASPKMGAPQARIVFFQRDDAVKGEVATQLGLEFVDLSEGARSALAKFIASELETGPGDAVRSSGAPPAA